MKRDIKGQISTFKKVFKKLLMFLNVQLNIDDTNTFLNVGDNIELNKVEALRKLGALFIMEDIWRLMVFILPKENFIK